jgi:methylglyoxal synthase
VPQRPTRPRPWHAKHLALVAHDEKKAALADWVAAHRDALAPHRLICTGTTGGVLSKRCPGLEITRVKSGPLGGDQQIGAAIAAGRIDALIFFIDPLTPVPHDVDVKALTRLAVVYDIPMALSPASAELLVAGGFLATPRRRG